MNESKPKILGQSAPTATTLTDLYTVPARSATELSGVVICNRGTAVDAVRLAISSRGAAVALKDYLYYDLPVEANDTQILAGGIYLLEGDIVRVYSTTGSTSFSAHGVEVYPVEYRGNA